MFLYDDLKNNFNLMPKDICYVGANEGQELPEMIKHFPDSKIHCFEPQKKPYNLLIQKFGKEQNLYFYNFALGDMTEESTIFTNTNNLNMSSSILKPKEVLNYHKFLTFEGTESINIKKFSDLNIVNVDFLNIDVQGYELKVLKGFQNLSNINFIKTEINRKEYYEDCILVKDLDKYLNNFGFIRIKTLWWKLTEPWGDALYIKKDQISTLKIFRIKFVNNLQGIKGYFWIISLLVKFKILNKHR